MKKKIMADIFTTSALIAISGIWLYLSYDLRRTVAIRSAVVFGGPDTFPVLIGWLMLLCSVMLLCKQLIQLRACNESIEEKPGEKTVSWGDTCRVLVMICVFILYAALLETVGFIPSSIVLMAVSMWLFHTQNKIYLAAFSISVTLILYYFFTMALGVRLP